uniref:Uncharacterized protein n=1 Tax=Cacopsylla melanoneura TaxID=428564 RepID=A0A8D8V4I9_9HEMI
MLPRVCLRHTSSFVTEKKGKTGLQKSTFLLGSDVLLLSLSDVPKQEEFTQNSGYFESWANRDQHVIFMSMPYSTQCNKGSSSSLLFPTQVGSTLTVSRLQK